MVSQKQIVVRERILAVTESLLKSAGRDSLTIRMVADAADIQLPTLYRLFEDKAALLDAVVERGFMRYMAIEGNPKGRLDIFGQLRFGWDIHVQFGLKHPELYALMYGESHARKVSPAAQIALDGLKSLMEKADAAGVLKVTPTEAALLAFSSGTGAVLSRYFLPKTFTKKASLEKIREAMMAAISKESP
jgi:AcrR family transcriptional regulator